MPFEVRDAVVWFVGPVNRDRTGLRAGSLVILGGDYAHDGTVVHFGRYAIDADPDTFAFVDGGWARDIRRVYHDGVPVATADPTTFRAVSPVYGRDAHAVFCRSRPLYSSAATAFEVVSGDYSRTAGPVFDCGIV